MKARNSYDPLILFELLNNLENEDSSPVSYVYWVRILFLLTILTVYYNNIISLSLLYDIHISCLLLISFVVSRLWLVVSRQPQPFPKKLNRAYKNLSNQLLWPFPIEKFFLDLCFWPRNQPKSECYRTTNLAQQQNRGSKTSSIKAIKGAALEPLFLLNQYDQQGQTTNYICPTQHLPDRGLGTRKEPLWGGGRMHYNTSRSSGYTSV